MTKSLPVKTFLPTMLLLALGQPAHCAGFEDLLKGYLKINPTNSAEQNLIRTNFDTRRSQLESQIQNGIASGQITSQEETELRNDLNNITTSQNAALLDGKLDQSETNNIVTSFTNLSAKIDSYMSNANVTNNAVNPVSNPYWYRNNLSQRGRWLKNDSQFRSDIDTKQAQIEATITQATANGTLNWNDAQRFRQELANIANDESRYLADGRMSYNDAKKLTTRLSSLSDEVSKRLSNTNRRWRGRGNYRNY